MELLTQNEIESMFENSVFAQINNLIVDMLKRKAQHHRKKLILLLVESLKSKAKCSRHTKSEKDMKLFHLYLWNLICSELDMNFQYNISQIGSMTQVKNSLLNKLKK